MSSRAALLITLACLAALCGAAPAWADPADQATNYQQNATHDGVAADAGVVAPLTPAWSVAQPGPVSYPLIADGVVVVARVPDPNVYGTVLTAYNQATGAVLWEKPLGGVYHFAGIAYDRGLVFAVRFGGELTAFDLATGATVWDHGLPTYAVSSPPTARDGVLYIPMEGGQKLAAVRERDGDVLWINDALESGAPAVDADSVYGAGDCGSAVRLDRADGSVVWRKVSSCGGGGERVVVLGDGAVWGRGAIDGPLARAASDGAALGPFSAIPAPAVGGGRVLTVDGGALSAAPSTGTAPLTWTFHGDGAVSSAPLLLDGQAFAGSSHGQLYAVDVASGASVWSASAGGSLANDESGTSWAFNGMGAANGTLVLGTGTSLRAYRTAGAIDAAPENRTAPSIDGAMQAGQRLAADVGRWSRLPDHYAYQWRRCDEHGDACADVAGATAMSYIPPADDAGRTFRVRIAAGNAVGDAAAVDSAATPPLIMALAVSQSAPAVSGEAREGALLTATPGDWTGSPTSFTYTWQRCDGPYHWDCAPVGPASATPTFRVRSEDVGFRMRVEVRAINAGGDSEPAVSGKTDVLLPLPPESQGEADVSGVPQVGERLTAMPGAWGGTVAGFRYQWFRCDVTGTLCPDIAGADQPTYTLTEDDVDSWVGVEIVGYNDGGESAPLDSPAVGPVLPLPPVPLTLPAVSGTPQVGAPLTVSDGTWRGASPGFGYRWFSCKAPKVSCATIPRAIKATYVPVAADLGRYLVAVVVAANAGGTTTAPSDAVGPVAAAPVTAPVGPVTVASVPPPAPVTAAATPPVTSAPPVTTFTTVRRRVGADGSLRLDERADAAGTFTAVATTGAGAAVRSKRPAGLTYAAGRLVVKAPGRVVLVLKPTRAGRAVLRRKGRLRLTVAVTFTNAAGGAPRRAAFAMTVRRPR